ncbi:unnamed protein product [Pleuronectes platessa]|uniref:Uncharacterized protein n=1 Tax=Pleuronectes platessa TaxID=8262 RepID=A0A9N7UJH5_PLEPL|nr:unnamed protein product [Pleuronectes platessa]
MKTSFFFLSGCEEETETLQPHLSLVMSLSLAPPPLTTPQSLLVLVICLNLFSVIASPPAPHIITNSLFIYFLRRRRRGDEETRRRGDEETRGGRTSSRPDLAGQRAHILVSTHPEKNMELQNISDYH